MKNLKNLLKRIVAHAVVFVLILGLLPSGFVLAAELPEKYRGYVFQQYEAGKTPDVFVISEGLTYTVENFPSADNKSLAVHSATGAKQFYIDLPITSGKNDCVIETSIAYEGTICSSKNFFSADASNGAFIMFMTIDRNGTISLFDGTVLATLTEGVFCDVALSLDFEERTCDVKINGKTKVVGVPIPNEKFNDIKNVRIQMVNITSGTETFYINHFYAKGEEPEDLIKPPVNEEITEETMRERMKGHILMTTKSTKARVNNEIIPIDPENPDFGAKVVNGTTMVPLRFVAEALGANVNYDEVAHMATITSGDKEIKFIQKSQRYFVNGDEKCLNVEPYNADGRMLVPLRAISENFNKEVFWDKCGYIIIGDDAQSFDLNNEDDKITLDLAFRDVIYDTVTSEEAVEMIKAFSPNEKHPRLLFTAEDVPKIREKIENNDVVKQYYEDTLEEVEAKWNAEPAKWGRYDGIRMFTTFVTAAAIIENSAFVYQITGDKKYAERAIKEMLNVCGDSFPDWNPYHFLDVGELCVGVAIAYDLCYDAMTEEERDIVETAIVEKALRPIMQDFTNDVTRSRTYKFTTKTDRFGSYPNNWVPVCVGGCMLGALVVADKNIEYADIAGDVISMGMEYMKDSLASIAPDGTQYEGPNYWSFCWQFYSVLFDSLENSCGTDYGFKDAPGLHEGGYYIMGSAGPYGAFNLNDCYLNLTCSADIYWLGQQFGDSILTTWRQNYMKENDGKANFKDVLWYEPSLDTGEPTTVYDGLYRGFNIASTRTGHGEADLYVAFHGGENGHNISDNDYGTFILDMLGERWAYELGTDPINYNPQGVARWNRYRARGEGHNTMVFNPDEGEDQYRYAICPIIRHEYNSLASIAVSDLTEAHAFKGAESVVRGIMVDKAEKYVIVQDEFKLKEPGEFYWFMHTLGDIEIAEDGRSAILKKGKKKMICYLIGGEGLKLDKMNAVPLPSSPDVPRADDSGLWKLMIHGTDISEGSFAVAIAPLAGSETGVEIPYTFTKISDWKLREEVTLPTLTRISVAGEEIELFENQTIYSATFDPYDVSGDSYDIKAEGNGEIKIEQVNDSNYVAKISVTDNGLTNNYYFTLTEVVTDDINFESYQSTASLMNAGSLSKIEIKSVFAPDVPQAANLPEYSIDGDYNTRYSSEKIGTTIDYDLGSLQKVTKVGVAFMFGNERGTRFRIAVSEDGEKWRVCKNVLSPSDTNDMAYYDIGEQNIRYVRLIGYGNTEGSGWFSPTEVGIFAD